MNTNRFILFEENSEPNEGEDAKNFVISLRAKYGDPEKALMVLGKENFKLRDRLRQTKAKVPEEGTLVLTKEQKEKWEAYEGLGVAPADIKTQLDKLPVLESTVQEFKDGEVIQTAANTLKFKANVLKDLLKTKGLQVEMREVTVKDGESEAKESRPFVKLADGKTELLSDYAKRDLKDYLPSLRAEEEAELGGVLYPDQSADGHSSPVDVVGKVLGDTYVLPSKRNES